MRSALQLCNTNLNNLLIKLNDVSVWVGGCRRKGLINQSRSSVYVSPYLLLVLFSSWA